MKVIVFLVLASPLLWLCYLIGLEIQVPTSALGADPGEAIVHFLGEWSLRVLLVAFSITPVYKLTRQTWLARSRRMAGLWAFSYVVLHMLAYTFFYLEFDLSSFAEDIVKRIYITAGIGALLCLMPMAITSTQKWRRKMGKRWTTLHKLVYPAVGLAIVHLVWLTRDDFLDSALYALWFAAAVIVRLYFRRANQMRRAATASLS